MHVGPRVQTEPSSRPVRSGAVADGDRVRLHPRTALHPPAYARRPIRRRWVRVLPVRAMRETGRPQLWRRARLFSGTSILGFPVTRWHLLPCGPQPEPSDPVRDAPAPDPSQAPRPSRRRYRVSLAARYRVGQRLPMARRTAVADCRFFLRQMPGPISSHPPPAAGDRVASHSAAGLSKTVPLPACPLLCQGLSQPTPMGRLARRPVRATVGTPSTRVPGVSIATSRADCLPPRTTLSPRWLAICTHRSVDFAPESCITSADVSLRQLGIQ